jgi:hypothetical protein
VYTAVGTFDEKATMFSSEAKGGPVGYTEFGELTDVAALNISNRLKADVSGTNTAAAVERGCAELRLIRAKKGLPPDYVMHLVIMTDGYPTVGVTDSRRLGRIVKHQMDTNLEGHAVLVHVLCLGNSIDRDVPRELTFWTGGFTGHAKTPVELVTEMERLTASMLGSSTTLKLAIVDKGVKANAVFSARYRDYGLITHNNNETFFTMQVADKFNAGMHIAATVGLANSDVPFVDVMLQFVPDAEYVAALPQEPPAEVKAKLKERRLQNEEKEKIREALMRNDFSGALGISESYTQTYTNMGYSAAAARSSFRTERLSQMSNATVALPQSMGADGASMAVDALMSQSMSEF